MASAQAGFRLGREQFQAPKPDPPFKESPAADAFHPQDRSVMLNFAIEIARDAGRLLLEKFDRNIKVSKKGDINLVTEADLASESLIIERIKSYYPKHSILAEESGNAVVSGGEDK